MKRFISQTLTALCLWATCQGQSTLIIPSAPQRAWHETNFYLFFHFGPNTFTNEEWGHGTESEDLFQPTQLDVDQWCRVAKEAGARGVVLTAKHHDGFCLWPSQFSTHTVRESPWMQGKGDVVRLLSEACTRHGLKLGLYLSPWDRNHPQYGTPEYNDVYAATLTELLTNYGELFEIWWDGANGEGPNGKKQVYDFHRFERIAAELQPNAIIFSDIGPGCRWAGNEQGTITETNWAMFDTTGYQRGAGGPPAALLQRGNERGNRWLPAECDVSIRPGWFYHKEEDDKVKSPDQLFDIYLKSVGRGANLILNVPPDRRGRIHVNDSLSLNAFGKKLNQTFTVDLAAGKVKPDLTITWDNQQRFSFVELREPIYQGQTIRAFVVEIWRDGNWEAIAKSTTIGYRKILQFEPVVTDRLRVRILDATNLKTPTIESVRVYR